MTRGHTGLISLFAVVCVTCAAPPSKPAEGPIADQIEASLAAGTETFDHSAWGRLLAEGTHDGRVDYEYMREHRDDLDEYLERIEMANLAALDPQHLEALLLNAYNALTVRSILDNWGVGSIREISGVWDTTTHRVGGFDLTLDQIEHNLIRPFFRDPRIHFAVNCASASCAPLPRWAFDGDDLDRQLEELTVAFLNDEHNVRVEGDTLYLSSYFTWYATDFIGPDWSPRADSVPEFVARYAPEVAALLADHPQPRIEFLDYDWSLNDVGG